MAQDENSNKRWCGTCQAHHGSDEPCPIGVRSEPGTLYMMPVPIGECGICHGPIYEGTNHDIICQYRNAPTLRDQFAMAALNVLPIVIEGASRSQYVDMSPSVFATMAYALADAMLEARKVKP